MTSKEFKLCPCGSNNVYSDCCQIFIDGNNKAGTPEELMRSRYTAFVFQKDEYILSTWHSRTRPGALNFEDNPVVWLGLEVEPVAATDSKSTQGEVTFTASYLENGQVCYLHETSEFLLEDGNWFYLRGICDVTKKK